jgi:hypothetical protein
MIRRLGSDGFQVELHAGNQRQGRRYHRRELRTPKVFASGEHSPAARRGEQALGRLSGQRNRRDTLITTARARVMALFRRFSRPLGMPDAFDRAPLR